MLPAGLIRTKATISEDRALAMGMLSPSTGVAAMATVLVILTAVTATRMSGVLGVATQTYWRLLASKYKPLPHIYTLLDAEVNSGK